MEKDFDGWNESKKLVNKNENIIDFHERELWWLSLGINIGVEIDGKHKTFARPSLIIRKFNKQMAWVLPITSQQKDSRFHAKFILNNKEYFVAITQIRTISVKRLMRKEGTISKLEFLDIKQRVSDFLITKKDPLLCESLSSEAEAIICNGTSRKNYVNLETQVFLCAVQNEIPLSGEISEAEANVPTV